MFCEYFKTERILKVFNVHVLNAKHENRFSNTYK
jgi:hypothetical protein